MVPVCMGYEKVELVVSKLVSAIKSEGWLLNEKKCVLKPCKSLEWLG